MLPSANSCLRDGESHHTSEKRDVMSQEKLSQIAFMQKASCRKLLISTYVDSETEPIGDLQHL